MQSRQGRDSRCFTHSSQLSQVPLLWNCFWLQSSSEPHVLCELCRERSQDLIQVLCLKRCLPRPVPGLMAASDDILLVSQDRERTRARCNRAVSSSGECPRLCPGFFLRCCLKKKIAFFFFNEMMTAANGSFSPPPPLFFSLTQFCF